MDTLTSVLVYSIGPFVLGGMLAFVVNSLANADMSAYEKLYDSTDSSGKTPWLIYPLKPIFWFNVWSQKSAKRMADLFKKQTWYVKLVLVYAMGFLPFLVMWMNERLNSLGSIGS